MTSPERLQSARASCRSFFLNQRGEAELKVSPKLTNGSTLLWKQEIDMAHEGYGGLFMAKRLARFAFLALVLTAAAAQAQPRPDRAPHHGNQGNDFNWLQSGGGG
jgi:hypothetical protein